MVNPAHIDIAQIDANNRLRPIDMAHAELIAVSIAESTLLQPIHVRADGPGYKLIIGGHRLKAMELLGMEQLEVGKHVIIDEMDTLAAQIAEIDENLARHELNALDRVIFLFQRKKLYEQKNPETAHGKASKSKALGKSQTLRLFSGARFTKETAASVGLSERTIQLACQIAEKLDPEAIAALRGTPMAHNQRELMALAEMEPEQQRSIARAITGGDAKTVSQAKISTGLEKAVINDPQSRLFATLLDAWAKAEAPTRKAFMEKVDLAYVKAAK